MEESGSNLNVLPSPTTQQSISGTFMGGDWWTEAYDTFWSEDIWLPEGVSWKEIDTSASEVFYYPILFSFVIMFLRYCVIQPFVLAPIAHARRIPNKRTKAPIPNKTLEDIYQQYQLDAPQKVKVQASKMLDMEIRQVERWLRRRYNSVKLNTYDKFIDCSFKLICHIFFAIVGLSVTLPKPWLWDTTVCYEDFANQKLPSDLWFYYMLILGYYWAITAEELPKPGGKGSDKMQMILHHTLTILLTAFSYTAGHFRMGGLIIFVHEYSDIALLAAKTCHYAGYDGPTEPLFVAFVVLWFLTRCLILPFWLMRSIFFEMPSSFNQLTMLIQKGWMITLFLLTMYWTGLVIRTVVRKLTGKGLQDVRSAPEDTSDSENDKAD
ncbi:ceramide synthase 2-like [Palaemon carinicauda]|uniref:ceramide synthase 2-like n=1 Tax=Palaemon carinicauda TaxID=392227 RepID=UPI0035B606A6